MATLMAALTYIATTKTDQKSLEEKDARRQFSLLRSAEV